MIQAIFVFHEIHPIMVHRDIKPENVLISNDTAIIVDFGTSKFLPELQRSASKDDFAPILTESQKKDILIYLENNDLKQGELEINLQKVETLAMFAEFAGSPNYMPIEAFGSFITRGIDLWALGATFNEMFSLEIPFAEQTMSQIVTKLMKGQTPEV